MVCTYTDDKTFIQYIYDKTYKDECKTCMEYNNTDIIYCLCNNDNNFLQKQKISICDRFCCKKKNRYDYVYNKPNKTISHSLHTYKELYLIAKNKNIKQRSLMSKDELYDIIFTKFEHCSI